MALALVKICSLEASSDSSRFRQAPCLVRGATVVSSRLYITIVSEKEGPSSEVPHGWHWLALQGLRIRKGTGKAAVIRHGLKSFQVEALVSFLLSYAALSFLYSDCFWFWVRNSAVGGWLEVRIQSIVAPCQPSQHRRHKLSGTNQSDVWVSSVFSITTYKLLSLICYK